MKITTTRWCLFAALIALLGAPMVVRAAGPGGPPRDVTDTPAGRRLVSEAAERHAALGARGGQARLRAWRIAPGEFVVADALPANFATTTRTLPDGKVAVDIRFDTEPLQVRQTAAATASPRWVQTGGTCFSRIGNTWGFVDSCYKTHRLSGETDYYWDYFQLEQYGSVGAKQGGKIYDGWMRGYRGGSAKMYWVDWSPRGTLTGGCVTVPISVSAMGVGISATGLMCERWDIFKSATGGDLKERWGCGCIIPFGQPYPNVREIDLMQAVKVLRNATPVWTLTAGLTALAGAG